MNSRLVFNDAPANVVVSEDYFSTTSYAVEMIIFYYEHSLGRVGVL